MRYPVILQNEIASLAANAVGSPSDFRGLQNRTDRVIRIEELRFMQTRSTLSGSGWIATRDGFPTSEVQLRLGNEPITADFVPLPAMTWPHDFLHEGGWGVSGGTADALGGYYLRFSKPVLLNPKQFIGVQYRHAATTSQRLVVTALCRPTDSVTQHFMPWIAKWTPPARTDGVANYVDGSTEADLVNPFDSEMLIERFIGRVFHGTLAGSTLKEIGQQAGAAVDNQGQLLFDSLRVRLDDHKGTQIVRDATPFGIVFEAIRKSWVVNTQIDSKGFYRMTLESKLATQIVSGTPAPVQAYIGMLGYRPVR